LIQLVNVARSVILVNATPRLRVEVLSRLMLGCLSPRRALREWITASVESTAESRLKNLFVERPQSDASTKRLPGGHMRWSRRKRRRRALLGCDGPAKSTIISIGDQCGPR
jgi:hypothetical protein